MMLKKRGFLIVVVLLFSLFQSFSVLGEWIGHCPAEQCVSIVVGVDDCNYCDGGIIATGTFDVNCNDPGAGGAGQCRSFAAGESVKIPLTDDDNDCNLDAYTQPQAGGCWLGVGDQDKAFLPEGADDCAVGRVASGKIWGNSDGTYFDNVDIIKQLNGNDEEAKHLLQTVYTDDKFEYLCADNGLWAPCYQNSQLGNQIVAAGKTHICTYDGSAYVWSTDGDGDGYNTGEDCEDDVSDDDFSGRGIECPSFKREETAGKSIGDIRKMARGLCEAHPGLLSHCAICINNGAAEVCGDKINNDCGGPGQKEKADELLGSTLDSCHLNQASCEQGFVGHCSESNAVCSLDGDCNVEEDEQCNLPDSAEEATGVCKYISPKECTGNDASTCGTQGEYECTDGKCKYIAAESCTEVSDCGSPEDFECSIASVKAFNIYNTEFDWIEIAEGGSKSSYCCGYEGARDAGEIRTELDSQQSFVCLTDHKEFVSTEKDFDGNGIEEIFKNNGCENKDWCWIDAANVNNLFKIFTIKRPGETPFDVVSNADDWFMCDVNGGETLKAPDVATGLEKELSNRFYCYQEGNRWAWAECTGDWEKRENPSVKGRYTGEGLYTLPLSIPEKEIPEEPTMEKASLRESIIDKSVVVEYKALYNKYYGKGFLDFSGYKYLNFMVRFVKDEEGTSAELEDLKLPLKIKLKLLGPKVDKDKVLYFEGNVLGNVINTPLSNLSTYMHVQVPIRDYKAVQEFEISSDSDNLIQVRNIYLSSNDTALPTQLCSGQESAASNTWIQNADAGNPNIGITGENLCEALYGEEAWLGEDQEVDEFKPAANCCGNAKNEYYAGLSKGYLPEGVSTTDLQYYGCWNSQPIASGDAIMDVEFQVESQETEFEVSYTPIPLPTVTLEYRVYDQKNAPDLSDDLLKESKTEGSLKCNDKAEPFSTTLEVGDTSAVLCSFILSEDFGSTLPLEYRGITKLWFTDPLSDDPKSPVKLFFYDRATNEEIGKEVTSATDQDDENFILSGHMQYLSKEKALEVWNHPLSVVAKLKPNKFFPIDNPAPSNTTVTQNVTYACSQTECLFPLPGNPPYKVTNLHPDLYELYYITGTLAADEKPITQPGQEFTEYANLKVKRIAQQVLYYNEGEESTKDIGFYGCRAADYIPNIDEGKNLQYCAVVGDKGKEKFCSYSEVHEEENNKDAFTIVNTWSGEGLTHVGYDTNFLKQPEKGQNISAYYESTELVLRKEDKTALSRNQSTSVLPARNFISNAEFATSATKIPYWEILVNNQAVKDEKSNFVKDNKVMLASNQKLRSERISVPSSVNLHFSAAQECTTTISLVDKNGNSQSATLPQFNTGDASYVIVEFIGPCEVEKPMLQVVDEFGPVEYPSKPGSQLPQEFANPDARSGAACCPDNHCWNGYACVEPMGTLTTVTEHVADGRDYRCIDGAWKRSVLKFDWNNQQWGFCPQESQCFVLGDTKIAKAENTAQSFYNGEYPICVNTTEYIFDNYCNQGNWTSRTKFLATKLLEVAENDEYVLYCSPYRKTLLDLGNNENYLGGEFSVTQKQTETIGQSLQKPAQPQVLPTCFNKIKDAQGKRLVPDSQNTCINNVCVLQYKEGGQFKVAFATTLNKEIDDPKSFLVSLNIPRDKLSQVCKGSGKDFIECNLQSLEFPSSADFYHSDELNAVIFARDGIQLSPGVIDNIVKWFKNLFGSGLLAEKTFVAQAQNFRNVYMANINGKKVRAVEEIFPGVKQTLVAEYQNFDTPVCEYVRNIKVPPELQLEPLEQASGIEKVHCAVNGSTQKVVVNAGLDFFWPQLTGKLRMGSE